MKEYPKIPNSVQFPLSQCYAFEKLDGSNLRFLYTHKNGFCRFGTRKQLFDKTHEVFGSAIDIFKNKYEQSLINIFSKDFKQYKEITVFAEFVGPNSFAGKHLFTDKKDIVMFDIWLHKYGLIGPEQFIKTFSHLNIAKLVWQGKFNGKFADDVRKGKYKVNEGVVCKAGTGGNDLVMCKIKTNAYMEKLKITFNKDWEQFWE